ncbi:MAG: glycosyltransferase family 4 protein [Actinomycetota bacterium]
MKVAIDSAPLLDPQTGVGRYVRELSSALEVRGVELVPFAVSFSGRSDRGMARWRIPARIAQEMWVRTGKPSIGRLIGPVDLIHATNFVLPPAPEVPAVLTIHDLGFFRDDTFPGGERLAELVPWSLARARRVLTPTQTIADEVATRFGVPEGRIVATPLGVSPLFFGATPLAGAPLEALGISPPFAVAVATLQPRKNLHRLLEAWTAARGDLEDWTLALVGPKGWGPGLPQTAGVVTVGWVGDETLPGLLAAADMFCYPSMYEGFGLPPLEAMAAGTPALVGDYGAAREVLGDAAALVDPLDVDALAHGLITLAGDEALRRSLATAGKARAARYTWDRTARATMEVYRAAHDEGRRRHGP